MSLFISYLSFSYSGFTLFNKICSKYIQILNKIKRKTLIVEDDSISYKLIYELASPHTDKIIQLSDGKEAVNYFKKNGENINLIVVDILLPKIDGLEVIKTIRKSHPKIPIIGISASTQVNKNDACYKAGCDLFVLKPIDVHSFEKIINQFLKKDPQIS